MAKTKTTAEPILENEHWHGWKNGWQRKSLLSGKLLRPTMKKSRRHKKKLPPQNVPALPMRRGRQLRANLARSLPACPVAISGRKGGNLCKKILNAGRLPYPSMLQS